MELRRSSTRSLALVLSCLGIAAAAPAGAEAQTESLGGVAGTEVRVARGEVTIVFPRDTASTWGWSRGNASRPYTWRVSMDDEGPPRSITLQIHPNTGLRIRDLEGLLSHTEAHVCWPAEPYCDSKRVRASVWDGRVVLSFRDSAAISEVFGLRPETATAYLWRPGMERAAESTVRVTYVDPQLPLPDSALRAAAAERRRSHFARVQRATRTIVPNLWLVKGDSAVAHVQERRCSYGTCVASSPGFPDARWSVADSSIARVRPTGTGTVQVFGLRPGRTVLRAAGLHGPRDTLPEWNPMPSETEREVVVTLPVAAVRLCPRRHIITGDSVPLHVDVVDSGGNVFRDPPVGIRGGPRLHGRPVGRDREVRGHGIGHLLGGVRRLHRQPPASRGPAQLPLGHPARKQFVLSFRPHHRHPRPARGPRALSHAKNACGTAKQPSHRRSSVPEGNCEYLRDSLWLQFALCLTG